MKGNLKVEFIKNGKKYLRKLNLDRKYTSKNGKKFNVKISYLLEKKPLGTAGSIYDLKNIKFKNILILNADIFTNLDFRKMFNFHLEKNNDITVLSVKNKN